MVEKPTFTTNVERYYYRPQVNLGLLKEITTLKKKPILNIDNIVATHLALNPENHRRTKHIKTRHFFIRELVSEDEVDVKHISTEFQLADCFTKPLSKPRLKILCDAIGLKP